MPDYLVLYIIPRGSAFVYNFPLLYCHTDHSGWLGFNNNNESLNLSGIDL